MDKHIEKRLKELNVEPDSKVGITLIRIYESYNELDEVEVKIKFLLDKREQLQEDIEMMEMLVMHKVNKDGRSIKWDTFKSY